MSMQRVQEPVAHVQTPPTSRAKKTCIRLRGGGGDSKEEIDGPCIGIDLGTTYRLVPPLHELAGYQSALYHARCFFQDVMIFLPCALRRWRCFANLNHVSVSSLMPLEDRVSNPRGSRCD